MASVTSEGVAGTDRGAVTRRLRAAVLGPRGGGTTRGAGPDAFRLGFAVVVVAVCTAAHRLWMTSLGAVQNARLCPQPCTGNLVRGLVTAASVAGRQSGRLPGGVRTCRLAVTLTHPGALLSDWRAAKAVAARVPGPASCARNARLAVRGPGLREHPPKSAVNTVILRYGRAATPCQRRRRGRSRQACPRRPVMPGEPGGNRQPVRRGPKSRPGEATTRSGRRSCRRWSLAADRSSAPSPTVPLFGRDSTPQPGSQVRREVHPAPRSPQFQCTHRPPASGNCLP